MTVRGGLERPHQGATAGLLLLLAGGGLPYRRAFADHQVGGFFEVRGHQGSMGG